MSGLYATIAILAALCNRENSGRGQHIDLGLLDVQVASLVNQATNYLMTGKVPKRLGNAHPNIVPYQDFPTTDGAVVIAVGNDQQFDRLSDVLGHPDWKADERFSTNPARVKNREVLIKMLNQITEKHDSNHWASLLEAAGIPCGPINNLAQVFQDPQVVAREMRIEMHHPLNDKLPLVASPMRFSETQVEYRHPPPLLGEHTEDVLSSLLKLDGEQIIFLKKDGII
jgi:crotonobetainyl-CoA:carnitine CoA-transferase CaiB-like acyl-CoA transferase